ncbi:hypothetical protein [Nocardia amamiensis]|uniref:hypothetical protein n=1 Tax=Nocardia amamiensis TaxID=404578 RepID=UPI0033FECC2C
MAAIDRVDVDPELFYVACLLHDHGLITNVGGQDFTLRGAARAEECGHSVDAPRDRVTMVADAITVHITPGLTVQRDGALGVYVASGALLDLGGTRAAELPRAYRQHAIGEHPLDGMGPAVIESVRAEVRANPKSRLALLRKCGFTAVIQLGTRSHNSREL